MVCADKKCVSQASNCHQVCISKNSKFDLERARELITLLEVASEDYDQYHDHHRIPSPEINIKILTQNDRIERQYSRVKKLWSNVHHQSQLFGFIAQRKGDDGCPEIFVVIRGTRLRKEWFYNFAPNREPYIQGDIRTGFLNIYRACNKHKPSLEQTIEDYFEPGKFTPQTRIFVTGHSLGGALATIATQVIRNQGYPQSQLYTFASPRVGDTKFAQSFNTLKDCYRIANTEDIVTTLPIPAGMLFDTQWIKKLPPLVQGIIEKSRKIINGVGHIFSIDFYADYRHVGEPIYFTFQKVNHEDKDPTNDNPTIGENHCLDTYKKALGLLEPCKYENQQIDFVVVFQLVSSVLNNI
jgi:triacylglycerol lipase